MNCKEERGKKGRENFCLNFSCLAIKMLILTDGRCHHGPSPAVSRGDLKADRTCLVIDWVGTLFLKKIFIYLASLGLSCNMWDLVP